MPSPVSLSRPPSYVNSTTPPISISMSLSAPLSTPAPETSPPRRSGMQTLVSWLRSPASFLNLRPPLLVISFARRSLKRPRPHSVSLHTQPPTVILQTYSASTDGIVLSAFPSAPFCCHEDLLTMSREQLEAVVRALNEKLPRRMQIQIDVEGNEDDNTGWTGTDQHDNGDGDGDGDVGSAISRMSEMEMRKWVEELVGIRRRVDTGNDSSGLAALEVGHDGVNMPDDLSPPLPPPLHSVSPSPSPVTTRASDDEWRTEDMASSDMDIDLDKEEDTHDAGLYDKPDGPTSSSTSFTMCARTYSYPRGRGNLTVPLASLKEENEPEEEHVSSEVNVEDESDAEPATKRRRVLFSGNEHMCGDDLSLPRRVPTAQGSRLLEDLDISASPLLDWDGDGEDNKSRGHRSIRLAIRSRASPRDGDRQRQKRTPNKLRRRRSALERERGHVGNDAFADASVPTGRPVSFPPSRFSIYSTLSRSSSRSRSCEAQVSSSSPIPILTPGVSATASPAPSPISIPIPIPILTPIPATTASTDTTIATAIDINTGPTRSSEPLESPLTPRILCSQSTHSQCMPPSPLADADHALALSQSRSSSLSLSRSWSRLGRKQIEENDEPNATMMSAGTPTDTAEGPCSSGDTSPVPSFALIPMRDRDTIHPLSRLTPPPTYSSITPSILVSSFPLSLFSSTPRSRAHSVSTVASHPHCEQAREQPDKEQIPEKDQAASPRDNGLGNVDLGEGIVEGIWMALEKMEVDVESVE